MEGAFRIKLIGFDDINMIKFRAPNSPSNGGGCGSLKQMVPMLTIARFNLLS